MDIEPLKEAMGRLLTTMYRMGLAVGSKSEVFVDGEVYSTSDLAQIRKEQDAEIGRLLAELKEEADTRRGRVDEHSDT